MATLDECLTAAYEIHVSAWLDEHPTEQVTQAA